MADCLLQQGHIVNIPRNSYRMRQHSELYVGDSASDLKAAEAARA